MAKFVKDTEINFIIEDIIKEAREILVLFCPYFKLHDRMRDCLRLKKEDHELRIIVVFGKNEDGPFKSLNKEDYEFLKSFPYIEVGYERRLHAKYYANEKNGLITSLNLHTHSQNNNIEVGVQFQSKNLIKNVADKTLGGLTSIISDTEDLATEASEFFKGIYINSEKIFQKQPRFSNGFLHLNKTYSGSEIILDRSDWFYKDVNWKDQSIRTPIGFNKQNMQRPVSTGQGFCIRTKEKINFDPSKPLSWAAYRSWSQNKNPNVTENYCHSCGKGHSTSIKSPFCSDCIQ
jgi:hypothetical protein